MEWIKQLRGRVVGLDTAPLIYFIEENSEYLTLVELFFESLDRGEFQAVTSTVTVIEVLVHPFRQNNQESADKYRDILYHADGLLLYELSQSVAERAARLRAEYNLRTPDAIQLATALQANASFFLTNDIGLPKIPGIEILVLDELKK